MAQKTLSRATYRERNTTMTKATRTRKQMIWQASALLLGVGLGCALFWSSGKGEDASGAGRQVYTFEASYDFLSRDEMIAQADAIILGRVVDISPARWNQDSGEIWQQSGFTVVPYHEVEIEVLNVLADPGALSLGDSLAITVLGGSPAGSIQSGGSEISRHAEHDLQVGDQAAFFVVSRELAWRGGTTTRQAVRPIVRFMGEPRRSYLTLENDGLYHSSDPGEKPTSLESLAGHIAGIQQP
jgi:hypothetical protein